MDRYSEAHPVSYGSGCVRIDRKANGYSVCVTDPAIVAANNARDSSKGPYKPWRDPERSYVFKDITEVLEFLKKNLDKALPKDDPADSFESAFDKAAAAASKTKD